MIRLETRLDDLERSIRELGGANSVAGTMLQRTLLPGGGVGWALAIGGMVQPKHHFHGATIDDAVSAAERFVAKQKKAG